jgi:hypothetical protein
MLYPIIPIYWPHPKLYLFNSHVCLVNPVGQAHPLWNYGQGIIRARKPRSHVHTEAPFQPYDHLRTQLIITCTHQRAHDHMYTQVRSSAHEWTNEWRNERTNEWTNQTSNQSINQPINQWINQSINQLINESRNPWTNEGTNEGTK